MESLGIIFSGPRRGCLRTERDPTALEFFSDSRLIAAPASKSNYPSFDDASTDFRRLFIKILTQTAHPLAAEAGELEEIDGAAINRSRDSARLSRANNRSGTGRSPNSSRQPASQSFIVF
jgi:hypothetical protein